MIKHVMIALVLCAVGCTKASNANETPSNDHGRGAAPRAKATVTLTAVMFADDCGGAPPHQAPASVAPAKGATAARRRCEQTAMQLSIAGAADTDVRIKSVEVFDETGKSLGVLATSKPTVWVAAKSAYEAWDEKIAAGQTAQVSYVLAQPAFVDRYDSHDRTYLVKVVALVGGVDQPLQTTVMVVGQPAPVPT